MYQLFYGILRMCFFYISRKHCIQKYGWNHCLDNKVMNLYLMMFLSYKHIAQMVKETQLYQYLRFIIMISFTMYTSTGRFMFERIHNTKEQIYFYERAENHKAKERMFKSFK